MCIRDSDIIVYKKSPAGAPAQFFGVLRVRRIARRAALSLIHISLFGLALGLSMDAFAVSISNSMCFSGLRRNEAALTSLSFGCLLYTSRCV